MSDDVQRLGRDPIPGAERAGTPARYEPEFQRLEAEVAKLSSLTGGEVDWAGVERDARAVLETRSKDLLVAAWLARAWWQRRGADGLAEGLAVLQALLETYWEDAQPPLARLRARRAALQWLVDGVAPALADAPTVPALARCRELADAIAAFCQPRFPDGDSGLGGLTRALAERLAATTAEPDGADAPIAETPPVDDARTEARPARARAEGEGTGDRAAALAQLRAAADWFQRHEPHSPVGYLVQRASQWATLPFQDLMRDLLANHPSAQGELWQVLGLPRPADS